MNEHAVSLAAIAYARTVATPVKAGKIESCPDCGSRRERNGEGVVWHVDEGPHHSRRRLTCATVTGAGC